VFHGSRVTVIGGKISGVASPFSRNAAIGK
jgi:hypothetical protein